MNREIKFRWFDKRTKTMIDDTVTLIYNDGSIGLDYPARDAEWVQVAGQYTGLKDKNGVEIYEGDIVKRWGNIYIVIWDKIGFRMKWTKEDSVNRFPDELCEVIGNIYENPELLNR